MKNYTPGRFIVSWILVLLVTGDHATALDPPITAAVFSHDEKTLIVGSQAGIQVLSWPALQYQSKIATDLSHIHDLKFAPDKDRLAVAGGKPGEVGELEIWNSSGDTLIQRSAVHEDLVYKVSWSPSGQHLCTASADGTCKIIDATNSKGVVQFSGHSQPVLSVLYLNSEQVCSMGADNTIRIWSSVNPSSYSVLDNHSRTVHDAVVRYTKTQSEQELELMSVGEDRTVRLWQPSIGRLVKFVKTDSIPRALVWSKSGKTVYVGCDSGEVQLINTDLMKVQERIQTDVGRIFEMLLENSEKRLLVAGENGCRAIELPLADGD